MEEIWGERWEQLRREGKEDAGDQPHSQPWGEGKKNTEIEIADIISTVEFNYSGDLLATGDKGGRVVIFQREQEVSALQSTNQMASLYSAYTAYQKGSVVFDIVDIKPANMEELTEVITAAEFHPHQCNVFVYSSSKGTIRLCDMRSSALCDRHAKFFEEPEDPSSRSFFSEIISSISDVKFSHSGRYMMTRDYLSVKVWDLNMEGRPVETHQVHEYLRSKLCSLYENDCIFDKFECCWNGSDSAIMTGSYNNFFRMFDRNTRRDVTLEASRENSKPRASLKPRKVCTGGKRKKDEISVDSLDFNKKILHTAWHPMESIIAVAATNNLYIFQDKIN
ncbi:Serine/threonine-protein phosphatase 2A 55 kDa regulatory subunit B delta isoform [Microtus ochrogaster]|uniref:Serine/threonine-protein phosphatase 2A 55 kDa regulatory subunit B n=1 Tax=Microtus ochrogaster TaxID=79684 RepID=A0A8J6KR60_MICOH|nr:Serine/threonine-protein phosphatase 2A 55 kDa regulatory subunit B delta isoform [Microtus ochrogaster]